ncbi:MAG: lysophospholipid acyltransferase family protein [Cystobacter sp.]
MAKGPSDTSSRSRGRASRAPESSKARAKPAPAEPVNETAPAAPGKKPAPAKTAKKKAPEVKEGARPAADPRAARKKAGPAKTPPEAASEHRVPAPVDGSLESFKPPEPDEAEVLAVESALLEQEAGDRVETSTRREIEEFFEEPPPPGPVDVPGFEAPEASPGSVALVGPSELFFTSASPGAESPRMGTRLSGVLSLAKEIAFQTLTSERLNRTVVSARGLVDAALTGLGLGGSTSIDEYGKDAALGRVLQPVVDFLYENYWRVSVQGASHVPSGPVLLVANHSGALPFDGPVLQQALSRERPDLQEARWLAEDQVFHAPVLGTLMNRLGAVRACPENALRLLDELRPVIVFPEGSQGTGKPFAQRYHLKRFGRGGFVKLALRTGAPIVPVAIVGAEETVPLLGKLPAGFLGLDYMPLTLPPLPARWTLRFGEPIGMGDLPPEAAEDLSQVQRLTERTRESIQGMLQALLKERRSVFAG